MVNPRKSRARRYFIPSWNDIPSTEWYSDLVYDDNDTRHTDSDRGAGSTADDRFDGIKSGITKDQRASHLKDVSLRLRRSLSTYDLPSPSAFANILSSWCIVLFQTFLESVTSHEQRIVTRQRTRNNELLDRFARRIKNVTISSKALSYLLSFIQAKNQNILGNFIEKVVITLTIMGISIKLLIKSLTFSRRFNVATAICLRGSYRQPRC